MSLLFRHKQDIVWLLADAYDGQLIEQATIDFLQHAAGKTPVDSIKKREIIILACYSKHFFGPHLSPTGASPLLWTSGLMALEAYSQYQRCSVKAAKNLLVEGW